jgi:hypothetical protein
MSALNNARLTSDQHQQIVYSYHSHNSTGLVTACIALYLVIVLHTYVKVEGNAPSYTV